MGTGFIGTWLAIAPILLTGKELQLCLDDQSKFAKEDMAMVTRMLRNAIDFYELPVAVEGNCDGKGTVRLTIASEPFEDGALGATRVVNGHPLPEIYVFRSSINRLLPSKVSLYQSRAITTVAIHELIHYLRKRTDHDRDGIFAPCFTPAILIARSYGR